MSGTLDISIPTEGSQNSLTTTWKVGDLIGLLDYNDVYCPAKILQIDGDRYLVTYIGW